MTANLNTVLQGRGCTALHKLENVLAFEQKFTVFARDLQRGTLSHFSCLRQFKQAHCDITINLEYLQSAIIAMQSLFGKRLTVSSEKKRRLYPFLFSPSASIYPN